MIVKDVECQYFFYKILHHVLVTNSVIYNLKIVDSPKYTFCDTEIETIDRIFTEGNMIHQLWKELSEFIKHKTGRTLGIEKSDIMLNKPEYVVS